MKGAGIKRKVRSIYIPAEVWKGNYCMCLRHLCSRLKGIIKYVHTFVTIIYFSSLYCVDPVIRFCLITFIYSELHHDSSVIMIKTISISFFNTGTTICITFIQKNIILKENNNSSITLPFVGIYMTCVQLLKSIRTHNLRVIHISFTPCR